MPSPVIVRRRLKKEARDAAAAAENAKIKEAADAAEAKKLKAEAAKQKAKLKAKAAPKAAPKVKPRTKKIKGTKTA